MVLRASDVLRKKASERAIMGAGRGLDTEKRIAQKTELWVSWKLDPQRKGGRKTQIINGHETELIIKRKRKMKIGV